MADDFIINCCFCGEDIETFCNAVAMSLTLHESGRQELWSHVTCLRAHLHASAQATVFGRAEEATAPINSSGT